MIRIIPANFFLLLKEHLPHNPQIIEAGAFNGRDTKKLANFWPEGTIHAFEPVPHIFEELIKQTSLYPNIKCYQLALSDTTGTTSFYCAQNPQKPNKLCSAGSILKPQERLTYSPIIYPHIITVPTITLDQWASDNDIQKIDCIWLDLQGHEWAVLQAANTLLHTTSLIYLEVNFIQAYENQPSLETINAGMLKKGFIPIAQDFDDTHTWFYGNILFARKNSD
jgi:FkbM family methyltransferase